MDVLGWPGLARPRAADTAGFWYGGPPDLTLYAARRLGAPGAPDARLPDGRDARHVLDTPPCASTPAVCPGHGGGAHARHSGVSAAHLRAATGELSLLSARTRTGQCRLGPGRA